MELLLLKDVKKVGKKGDVVRAREGYARNFLIPNNLALPATRANKEFFDDQRKRSSVRKEKEKQDAEKKVLELQDLKISLNVKAGEGDKLFGSVTSEDIAKELSGKGFSFEKKQIHLKNPLKALGSHQVEIELYSQVKTNITVELLRQDQ